MKTTTTHISQLTPGDKLFVPKPATPTYSKMPEILTVKRIELHNQTVIIEESGGLCLVAPEYQKIQTLQPQPGDTITFDLEYWDDHGFEKTKEHSVKVLSIITDPLKRHETKCRVNINGQDHGVPLSQIKETIKQQAAAGAQLKMFN
jgi:hypothetical protein